MPHVVLNGDLAVEDVFRLLKPIFIKEEGSILKTGPKYMDDGKRNVIIEALAIEKGEKKEFLIMISQREDGIVIRLHPVGDFEKTVGVKRLLAETAKQLILKVEGVKVGKTNLSEFF